MAESHGLTNKMDFFVGEKEETENEPENSFTTWRRAFPDETRRGRPTAWANKLFFSVIKDGRERATAYTNKMGLVFR